MSTLFPPSDPLWIRFFVAGATANATPRVWRALQYVPPGDYVPGASRYAPKRDLRTILQSEYFRHRGYANNIIIADNLISLVTEIVFDHVEYFSPKV